MIYVMNKSYYENNFRMWRGIKIDNLRDLKVYISMK